MQKNRLNQEVLVLLDYMPDFLVNVKRQTKDLNTVSRRTVHVLNSVLVIINPFMCNDEYDE